ncbi:MAG: transposase [Bacteroidia bacterium]
MLSSDLDEVILYLYSQGSSYQEISAQMEKIYGVEVSESTITRVTDKVWPLIQEWRSRPLDAVYPFVWMDAIHYKVRKDGSGARPGGLLRIGVNSEGYKSSAGHVSRGVRGAKFCSRCSPTRSSAVWRTSSSPASTTPALRRGD